MYISEIYTEQVIDMIKNKDGTWEMKKEKPKKFTKKRAAAGLAGLAAVGAGAYALKKYKDKKRDEEKKENFMKAS